MKSLLFTYGLCYGGSIASLWRPYYGLLIYVCFALIKPEITWFWAVPRGNYSRIIALSLLAGWAIHGFGRFHFGKSKWIVGSLFAYIVWATLSAAFSPDPQLGFDFVESQFKIVLPVVVGATLIKSYKQLLQLAWTIVLSMGFLAMELNQYYFQGNNVLERDGFVGMDNNSFAIGLVTAVGLAFFLGLGSKRLSSKLICLIIAALITHAVLFSFSRGAMLALCVVGFCCFWYLPKRPVNLAVFGVGLILAFMMAGDEVMMEFSSTFADENQRDSSSESRIVLWGACIELTEQHPIMGIGPDRFTEIGHFYHPYEVGKEAHSLWLTTSAELGLPGVLFLLTFYLGTMIQLVVQLRMDKGNVLDDPFERYIPQMVIASLAGFIVAAQFVSLERLEIPFYVTLLGVGALKVHAMHAFTKKTGKKLILVPTTGAMAREGLQPGK